MMYLSNAIATYNGTYLNGRFGDQQFIKEVIGMNEYPEGYEEKCSTIMEAEEVNAVKEETYKLLTAVRNFFKERTVRKAVARNYNYGDLAGWYYEMQYSFRRLFYYVEAGDIGSCYELAGYIQTELDIVKVEFGLETMDLMGEFHVHNLKLLSKKAEEIRNYIISVIKTQGVKLKVYTGLNEFFKAQEE